MKRLIIICLVFFVAAGTLISQTPEPTPAGSWGELWFEHPDTVELYTNFDCEIHLNSGDQILAAYGMDVNYDDQIIEVDSSFGNNGVEAGPDGFLSAVALHDGYISVTGFDVYGTGPGTDLHILTIRFTAQGQGTSDLTFTVDTLVDLDTSTIGNGYGIPGSITVISTIPEEPPVTFSPASVSIEYPAVSAQAQVVDAYSYGWSILSIPDWITVTPSTGYIGTVITVTIDFTQFLPNETKSSSVAFLNNATTGLGYLYVQGVYTILTGDVNTDGVVDIIDALLIAQYYVGLDPANFNPDAADTDCNGTVDIIDALLTSQYYVELISGFCE